jgi:3-oxoacyl-[acyl-carrier protein] reductase
LGPIGPFASWQPKEFVRTVEVNLYGTMLALHHCVAEISQRGGGAVTFGGGGAASPMPHFDAYASSKAAVARLTENLARQGARVNCVAPGFIATEMHQATLCAGRAAVGSAYFERTRRELESGGAPLTPVCELVEFLLSPSAKDVRGKLIAAQWDPWRDEDFRRRLVDDLDFATIRRVDDQLFTKL